MHFIDGQQLASRIPPDVPPSEAQQTNVHSLESTFIGQIMSPICPRCRNGEKTAELLFLFCPKWAAENQRYFSDSTDMTDVF